MVCITTELVPKVGSVGWAVSRPKFWLDWFCNYSALLRDYFWRAINENFLFRPNNLSWAVYVLLTSQLVLGTLILVWTICVLVGEALRCWLFSVGLLGVGGCGGVFVRTHLPCLGCYWSGVWECRPVTAYTCGCISEQTNWNYHW